MSREDWEVFDILKQERQEKRGKRRMSFEEEYAEKGWTRHHETHYSRTVNGERLDYWPGPKKWRFKGKTMYGDVDQWLRKHDDTYVADGGDSS